VAAQGRGWGSHKGAGLFMWVFLYLALAVSLVVAWQLVHREA
jgi:hypothetical protein